MTKRERALIRSCVSNGFEFRNRMQVLIGKDMIDYDRFNALAEELEFALDRQEPLMPADITSTKGYKVGTCGVCWCGVDEGMEYCIQCGQKIKWEVDTDV